MAKTSDSQSRPLETITEHSDESSAAPNAATPQHNNASPQVASPAGFTTDPPSWTTTPDPSFGVKRERNRRSSLYLHPTQGEEAPIQWYCSSYELSSFEKNAVTKEDSHDRLLREVANSNEDLQLSLDAFANQYESSSEPLQGDPMAAAIDHKFELIRYTALKAVEAHDEAVAVLDAEQQHHAKVVADMTNKLEMAEKENATLLNSVKDLLAKVAELRAQTTTMAGSNPFPTVEKRPFTLESPYSSNSPTIVDITVPKAYRTQIQAAPIKYFEGSTDVETVYTFLKALDHHIRLLPNAFMVLNNKLEKMELRGADIARINDTYRATLDLLGVKDLSTIDESHQYFQMYMRKIKDPHILSTLTLSSLSNNGLNLEDLLRYTARLMVIKSTTPSAKNPSSSQTRDVAPSTNRNQSKGGRANTKKPHKASVHNIEEGSEEESEEAVAAVSSKPATTNRAASGSNNYNPRRCFFCDDTGHMQSDCAAKKALLEQLKAGKA
ncbi:hypothetical protein BJ508DRAFT_302691 [Ascobolus immersus RN42]|uniref:CCHC-type domain-containing protein n=1 Tax=Ascobolus immersus RN42 TaxID=1160509 RepID=A0A3N4IIA3_ASCIM|nr:hypothetical protein BJ508DRAFT_302691 [Ascobolus immersus RN42]